MTVQSPSFVAFRAKIAENIPPKSSNDRKTNSKLFTESCRQSWFYPTLIRRRPIRNVVEYDVLGKPPTPPPSSTGRELRLRGKKKGKTDSI